MLRVLPSQLAAVVIFGALVALIFLIWTTAFGYEWALRKKGELHHVDGIR